MASGSVLDTTVDLDALFRKQVDATPDARALQDIDTSLTYRQLDARVESLSLHLRRAYAITRDVPVGVLFGRCADYVIACMAILRAGGAYVVLELAYPAALLQDVIEDARPAVILTHSAHLAVIRAQVPTLAIDDPDQRVRIEEDAKLGEDDLPARPRNDDLDKLCFVAYSSGTTGRPKGIANPHRACVLSYSLRFKFHDVRPTDRVALNVYFVWEMIRPLLRGATVICMPDAISYDPVGLVKMLAEQECTETLMTSTLLAAVLLRHADLATKLPKLRTLWLNGEVVSIDLARRATAALPKVRLLNCYSACETHEVACGDVGEMLPMLGPEATCCPVGQPMELEHCHILDEEGRPVGEGEAGELFVGGSLLAQGYLNMPETTAGVFVPDTFSAVEGARMYKTGDIARLIPSSGLLEITGRTGGMIKVRGFSIVPQTVEHAIVERLAVDSCAVIAHGQDLERQLVAYFVPSTEGETSDRPALVFDNNGRSPSARSALVQDLAHYMIPQLWIAVDLIPTHAVSGKADLKSLPTPAEGLSAAASRVASRVPSRTGSPVPDETINRKSMAGLWALSLNIDPATVLDTNGASFFDLGGHSLALANLATRISKTFGGFRVPLGELAGAPTLDGHLRVTLGARNGYVRAVQADLRSVLEADMALADDIKPTTSDVQLVPFRKAKCILLTGATGFLGGNLLHDLLEQTDAKIVCLIRFNAPYRTDRSAAMARLRNNMLDLGLWSNDILDRVEVIPSNLSRNRLGLIPEVYEELRQTLDIVVHCAAQVNLVYPYAALRDANVEGTREVLKLVALAGATLQYISTNGVLSPSTAGWSEDEMLPIDDVQTQLHDGYCQTKWVAEQMVLEAARRGLPAKVIRIGTLSGDSETGSTNTYDLVTALIVEALHLGVAPNVDEWRIEMTPVDFVSKGVIAIGQHDDPSQHVYHLGDDNPTPCSKLFDRLAQLGYETKRIGWTEWVALWQQERGNAQGGIGGFTVDILRSGMPSIEFLTGIIALRGEKTRGVLDRLQRPPLDVKLLETYAKHWYARGWLATRPKALSNGHVPTAAVHSARPLAGRTAVVIGASSGIGAAVARALAREGASVSMAARRLPALKELSSNITRTTRGARTYAKATDVTDRAQVEALFKSTVDELGPIDFVVNCAGVMYFQMMESVKADEWDQTVAVNCQGLLNVLAAALPRLLSRDASHFVAISSDAGRKCFPGLGVYSASKFFVEATLQAIRLETVGRGLRVTSVQPGNVDTDLLSMSTDAAALEKYGTPSGAKVLDPEDVAGAIVYALRQPAHVAVNEVLIEPRDEPI